MIIPGGIRLRRPSIATLRSIADDATDDELTYAPVGMSLDPVTVPSGFHLDRWSRELGAGDDVFGRAVEALRTWQVQSGAGLFVAADGAPREGQTVAIAAPLPIGFVDVVCRVVTVIAEPDRAGFAYGTLPTHPERGEESFVVTRHGAGTRFDIVAVSRPAHPLARLVPPVARRLQAAAVRRYLDAMEAAVRR